jgi:predicted nucleic acid-binding protein
LKVFFDTNVLIDVAVRTDEYPHSIKVVNEVMERSGDSPWVSAISLNNIEYIVSKLGQSQKAYQLLQFIRNRFSIIPFRKSVFVKALNIGGPDFEDAIQMASAEEMWMDYIVTRNKDHFEGSKIPAVTPSEFLEKWNAGEFDQVSNVPFLDLKEQHHQIYNEVDDRITDIIGNTGFILGKHVEEFEERFAEAQGAKYCVGVSSGTDALHVALLALGIGHGDRVVVPVNTFIATAEAVSLCGAEPVFVDCDKFYNLDVKSLKESLSAMSHQPSAISSAEGGHSGAFVWSAGEYGWDYGSG